MLAAFASCYFYHYDQHFYKIALSMNENILSLHVNDSKKKKKKCVLFRMKKNLFLLLVLNKRKIKMYRAGELCLPL